MIKALWRTLGCVRKTFLEFPSDQWIPIHFLTNLSPQKILDPSDNIFGSMKTPERSCTSRVSPLYSPFAKKFFFFCYIERHTQIHHIHEVNWICSVVRVHTDTHTQRHKHGSDSITSTADAGGKKEWESHWSLGNSRKTIFLTHPSVPSNKREAKINLEKYYLDCWWVSSENKRYVQRKCHKCSIIFDCPLIQHISDISSCSILFSLRHDPLHLRHGPKIEPHNSMSSRAWYVGILSV